MKCKIHMKGDFACVKTPAARRSVAAESTAEFPSGVGVAVGGKRPKFASGTGRPFVGRELLRRIGGEQGDRKKEKNAEQSHGLRWLCAGVGPARRNLLLERWRDWGGGFERPAGKQSNKKRRMNQFWNRRRQIRGRGGRRGRDARIERRPRWRGGGNRMVPFHPRLKCRVNEKCRGFRRFWAKNAGTPGDYAEIGLKIGPIDGTGGAPLYSAA